MPVHLSPWACPTDFHPWFAVSAPYHADFVAGIKDSVPGYARKWLPEVKLWVVRFDFKEELDLLLRQYYRGLGCSLCIEHTECAFWARSRLLDFGRPESWSKPKIKDSTPEPPRPSYQSRVEQYAALLGLRWPAPIPDIKTAFKQKALQVHPDRGGSHEAFLAVRNAAEFLLRQQGASL